MTDFLEDDNFKQLAVLEGNIGHEVEEPMTLELFVSLMKQFYDLNWMKGTGGAMGCMAGHRLFISPSALQKERLSTKDVFVYCPKTSSLLQQPKNHRITVSSCAVLFSLLMSQTGATCVIHTHSKYANLITQMITQETFDISHQEYIKGVWDPFTGKNLGYEDTLTIPIIENMKSESLLLPGIKEALLAYPRACAVLVRNHGLFVWGPTWEQTKIMVECIDYLLEIAMDMLKNNLPLVREPTDEIPASTSDYQLAF